MRFTIATVIAALPFLIAAAPHAPSLKVPLSKRSDLVKNGVVDAAALKGHVDYAVAKIHNGLDNYKKNTGVPHPSAKGLRKRRSGGIPLADKNNQLWQGEISVSFPLDTYTVDFDTGSSDLFLPGPNCKENCDGHTIYHPGWSSTDLNKTFSLSYGDGSTVSGEQYTDIVDIAGLTAFNQTLGAATQYSKGFSASQFPADGLMGMAFQEISRYSASPVFQTLVSERKVHNPVFAFKLATSGSELYIGGTNPNLYTGDFSYVPVTQKGYWQVNMDGVLDSENKTVLNNVNSIIDTGTTAILGDAQSVAEVYRAIGGTDASATVGKGYYTFPCDQVPSFSLTFGGKSFPVSASTFNLGSVASDPSNCVGGLIASNVPFWVIGDVFLRNVYTVFDFGNTQVGFATLK